MRRRNWISLTVALLTATSVRAGTTSETVAFMSGDKVLHGLLYMPAGKGPFPAVLYNHGSSPGLTNNVAFDAIAPWVFLRRIGADRD